MKKIILISMILLNVMMCFALVTDPIIANISGYVVKSSQENKSVMFTVTHNSEEVSPGDILEIGHDYVGVEPQKMFSWNFVGNYYRTEVGGVQGGGYLVNPIKVSFTLSPLTGTKNDTEYYLPFSYKFDGNYTSVNSIYLGDSGATVKGKTLNDQISVTAEGDGAGTVDKIDVSGKVGSTPHVITYTYVIKDKNFDPGYEYLWSRSGDIYIAISDSDYKKAQAIEYTCNIAVEIWEEK